MITQKNTLVFLGILSIGLLSSCKKNDTNIPGSPSVTISTWKVHDTTYTEGNYPTTFVYHTELYVADATLKNDIDVVFYSDPLVNTTYSISQYDAPCPAGTCLQNNQIWIGVKTRGGYYYTTGRSTDKATLTVRKLGKVTLTFTNLEVANDKDPTDKQLLSGTLIQE